MTHFEQLHKEALDYVTVENLSSETLQMLKEQPCVISSFHFGSYRLLNAFLTKNGIPYTAACPKAIFLEKEGEMFLRNLFPHKDARFIELESPALGLKIIKELEVVETYSCILMDFVEHLTEEHRRKKKSIVKQRNFVRKELHI